MGELADYIADDAVALFEIEIENAERVLAHFFACEKFLFSLAEIQSGLDFLSHKRHAEIEVRQQQPALPVFRKAAGVEKPCGRSGRIDIEQLEKLLFQRPQREERVLADANRAEIDHRAEKGDVLFGVGGAFADGQLEAGLQPAQINRRAVQYLGHICEAMHDVLRNSKELVIPRRGAPVE